MQRCRGGTLTGAAELCARPVQKPCSPHWARPLRPRSPHGHRTPGDMIQVGFAELYSVRKKQAGRCGGSHAGTSVRTTCCTYPVRARLVPSDSGLAMDRCRRPT